MKVNRTYKVVRPMRKFGNLIKDLFSPKDTNYFWVRVNGLVENHKEKEEQIISVIELLDNRIKTINKKDNYYGQDTEY